MIKLAVDNSNVVRIDHDRDIAKSARDFADRVEAGEFEGIESVLILVSGNELQRHVWGDLPTPADACFMFDLARTAIIRDLTDD